MTRTKSSEGIWKTPSGSYIARWREPSGAERTKTFAKYEDARAHRKTMLESRNRGTYVSPKRGKVRLEDWYGDWMVGARLLTPQTRALYEDSWARYIERKFGRWGLAAIERKDVEAWIGELQDRGVKPSGVEVAVRLLRRLLSEAVKEGVLGRNPAAGIELEAGETRPRCILSRAEVLAIADAVEPRFRALVLLLASAGLRVGEACALTVGDVDLLRRRVTISKATAEVRGKLVPGKTKSKRVRTVDIPAFVADEIAAHIERFGSPDRSALLFTSPEGKPLRRTTFRSRAWSDALEAVGLGTHVGQGRSRRFVPGCRIHDLRHTAVALAIEAGAHPKQVQEMVGHAKITTTLDTYGHLFPTLGERLAEALDAGFREAQAAAADSSRTPRGAEVVALPVAEAESTA